MTCPVCGGDTTVVCCRSDCESVYRRRKCLECAYVFHTSEVESDSAEEDFKRLNSLAAIESKQRRNAAKHSLQSLRDTVNLLGRSNATE